MFCVRDGGGKRSRSDGPVVSSDALYTRTPETETPKSGRYAGRKASKMAGSPDEAIQSLSEGP